MSIQTPQSPVEHYDNLILGSGEAGKYLAWTFAKKGERTAMVERSLIGGSCPNIACLPSKNVVHSAKVATLVNQATDFGIATGPIRIDMAGVRNRKRKMVDTLIKIHLDRYKASGVELIMGQARFVAPRIIEVQINAGGTRQLTAERIILSLGTRSTMPSIPGLAESKPLTHIELLELDRLPEHLIILGGGYIGLEFAQAMRRFGSQVTIIERGPQLASREDPDVSQAILQLFQDEGVRVLLNTELESVEGRSSEKICLRLRIGDKKQTLEATDILVATGRTPNTQNVGLDLAGVQLDARGYIAVNERLETSVPGIWAVGDCAGSPQFTHAAFDDFRIVRDNVLNNGSRSTKNRLIPFCMFTDPELARVGLSETEARQANIPYRLATIPVASVLRTQTLSETRGFLKALIATDSDRILGFTAFGVDAGELIAVVQTAMLANIPYTTLRDTIYTHPTMAEGLTVLFANPPAPPSTH